MQYFYWRRTPKRNEAATNVPFFAARSLTSLQTPAGDRNQVRPRERRGNAPSRANSLVTAIQVSNCTSSHPNMLVQQLPCTLCIWVPSVPVVFVILPRPFLTRRVQDSSSSSTTLAVFMWGNLTGSVSPGEGGSLWIFPGNGPQNTPAGMLCLAHTLLSAWEVRSSNSSEREEREGWGSPKAQERARTAPWMIPPGVYLSCPDEGCHARLSGHFNLAKGASAS